MASISKGLGWFTTNASTAFSVLGTKVQEGAKLAVQGASVVAQEGSRIAVQGAGIVNEKVIKPTSSAIQDPNLTSNVSSYMSTLGQKVSMVGSQGVHTVSKWMSMDGSSNSPKSADMNVPQEVEPYSIPWNNNNSSTIQQNSFDEKNKSVQQDDPLDWNETESQWTQNEMKSNSKDGWDDF